jgi:hypothetical protein
LETVWSKVDLEWSRFLSQRKHLEAMGNEIKSPHPIPP